jgi:hypothetical protein
MLDAGRAGVLEALVDERLAGLALPEDVVAELHAAGLPGADTERLLARRRAGREIAWASRTVAQGELLAAFAHHCERALEDVDGLERSQNVLVARWRRETSRLEQRAGFVGFERLASDVPTMLLGDIEADEERLVLAFVDDADLRTRLAVCDLARLERIGAVRSSVFVYLEWFLRDAYGVKLQPSPRFTQGLIDRGIISLGMG